MKTQHVLHMLVRDYPLPDVHKSVVEMTTGATIVDRAAAVADLIDAYMDIELTDEEKKDPEEVLVCATLASLELLAGGWAHPADQSEVPPDGYLLIGVRMGEVVERTLDSAIVREWVKDGGDVYWRPWIGDPIGY
jgi:hypothetical protein